MCGRPALAYSIAAARESGLFARIVVSTDSELIAVRSDWTDPRGLIGYENPITERYTTTPLLDLLVRAEADPESVDEAVDREAGRADRADSGMRPRLLGLVTVVEDEEALRDEEEEKPGADDRERVARIPERPERLRKDVEERDRDDDASGKGDQCRQLSSQAQCDQTARERREDGDAGKRYGDPRRRDARHAGRPETRMRTILKSTPGDDTLLA